MSIGGVNDELIEGNTTKVVKTTFHGETEEKSISNTDAMEQFLETSWAAWDKLYRRELFDGIRYPVGEINEDEAIVLQLLERCTKVAYTNKVFYHYIRRPESITTSTFTEKKLAWYRHCVDNLEWIKAHHPELEPLAAKRLCGSVIYFADEISCANKKYWHLMNDLLSDLRKKYRSYIRKFPNGIDKLKLYILRYAPYEVYRIIMRTGRWVHAKI